MRWNWASSAANDAKHLRSKVYYDNYMNHFPPAEPAEEWEEGNRLYSLKYSLNHSAGHPGDVYHGKRKLPHLFNDLSSATNTDLALRQLFHPRRCSWSYMSNVSRSITDQYLW